MTEQLTLRTLLDDLIATNEAPAEIAKTLTVSLEQPPTPWFVNALVAVSAWLSVIPFLAFINHLVEGSISAIIVGLILLIGTVILHYFKSHILFLDQLALALNLTGQVLLIYGIAQESENVVAVTLATLFLEMVLIGIYSDNILRFISVLIATTAALVLLYDFKLHQGIHILIVLIAMGAVWYWITEASHLTDQIMASLHQPLAYAFIIALQMILLLSILPPINFIPPVTWWYSTMGLTVLLLALEYYILHSNQITIFSVKTYTIFAGTLLVALLLYQSPGIIASIIVLVLGFQRSNRVLMGLALVFLSVFLIAYYYHLNITLLMKSISLMSAGLALLGLRFMFKHIFPLSEGGQ
ncbi:MAG: DUF4401 domain-containing protein [Pseudomonadota bacterium]